ncbi:hypothetical protein WA026_022924 [Henosepilachna vigintioctopunctata]|uniref:PHD-type domain-containing protein n=1 Tax=Henosepilachna vigintioctopunctata TaxID=420089 RepID=A0AAW1TZH3_9CUCU
MTGNMVCITCRKSIGKNGYKIQCAGECGGWAHLACTSIKKEEIIQKKKLKWICPECEERDTASPGETSEEEEIPMKKMSSKIKKRIYTEQCTHNGRNVQAVNRKKRNGHLKNQAVANAVTADFQTRRNNVIMIGLSKTAEVVKVLNKLDINIKDEEIKTRQISSKGHMKPILVTFPSESVRNEVLLKRKAKGLLNSENMELDGDRRNIYINEDLPKITRDLFRKASELKNIGYMYVWVKEEKFFVGKVNFQG